MFVFKWDLLCTSLETGPFVMHIFTTSVITYYISHVITYTTCAWSMQCRHSWLYTLVNQNTRSCILHKEYSKIIKTLKKAIHVRAINKASYNDHTNNYFIDVIITIIIMLFTFRNLFYYHSTTYNQRVYKTLLSIYSLWYNIVHCAHTNWCKQTSMRTVPRTFWNANFKTSTESLMEYYLKQYKINLNQLKKIIMTQETLFKPTQ